MIGRDFGLPESICPDAMSEVPDQPGRPGKDNCETPQGP